MFVKTMCGLGQNILVPCNDVQRWNSILSDPMRNCVTKLICHSMQLALWTFHRFQNILEQMKKSVLPSKVYNKSTTKFIFRAFKVRNCNSLISDVAWTINVTQVINKTGYYMIQILMGITLRSDSAFIRYLVLSELRTFHNEKNLWHNKALKRHPVSTLAFAWTNHYTLHVK
jgi:hypothetical protein